MSEVFNLVKKVEKLYDNSTGKSSEVLLDALMELRMLMLEEQEKYKESGGCRNCGKKVRSKGYCAYHLTRARENGEFGGKRCSEIGCEKFDVSRGFCWTHYHKARREGRIEIGHGSCQAEGCSVNATADDGYCKEHRPAVGCSIAGCVKPVKARGLCAAHYQAKRREEGKS